MLTEIDLMTHLEHYKDLLREVEQERLAQLVVSAQAKKQEKKAKIQKNTQRIESPCCKQATCDCRAA